jgi:defect-in-organelle-trafficking protein DotC
MFIRWLQFTLIFSLVLLSSCATKKPIRTDSLKVIRNLTAKKVSSALDQKVHAMRQKGLREIALRFGAQAGLAHSTHQLQQALNKHRDNLDAIFNFNAMMLEHGVMPPVLSRADNNVHTSDPNVIRISKTTYKIVKQAHFSPSPPNWRNYLSTSYNFPKPPNKALLPRNSAESRIWKKYVTLGWKNGDRQATSIFQDQLARLTRDYRGMIIYHQLLAEHMVSKPFVASMQLGVTGDGKSMNINDQVLRITALPTLKINPTSWRAIVVKHHGK